MVRELYTIAELARLNGVTERQADYAARQARIEPAGRVGIIRVYDAQAAEQIAADLARHVARILSVPFADVLRRTDTKRYHHPRQSMNQAAYRVDGTPPPVGIVVDDMITSGTTMKLSLEALREAGAAAFGFALAGC